jgi:DNA-binding transcriptional MerR regulator
MIDVYTISDVEKILGIRKKRLSDWLQRGFIKPSAHSKGQGTQAYFLRDDMILIELFRQMLDLGLDRSRSTDFFGERSKTDADRNKHKACFRLD